MPIKQMIFLSIIFILALYVLLRLVIHHKIREGYAVIWFIMLLFIPVAIILFPFVDKFGKMVGIYDSINFLFFVAILVLSIISLHFSILNSKMQNIIKNLVQKIAILEDKSKHLKDENN